MDTCRQRDTVAGILAGRQTQWQAGRRNNRGNASRQTSRDSNRMIGTAAGIHQKADRHSSRHRAGTADKSRQPDRQTH